MVLLKKWPLFELFFLGATAQENIFYDILERKNAFLTYKNKKLKKSGQENVFYDILEGKNAFLTYKNKKIKTSRN